MQLRLHRTASTGSRTAGTHAPGRLTIDEDTTLAQLVSAAAAVAPAVPAICKPGLTISFGELSDRATGAATVMAGAGGGSGSTIDDSALTVALMMTVPGLAASGPSGLAATLSGVRIQATMAIAGAREV